LRSWAETCYSIRIQTHPKYKSENDQLSLVVRKQMVFMDICDRERLSKWVSTLLTPFVTYLEKYKDGNFHVFVDPTILVDHLLKDAKQCMDDGQWERTKENIHEVEHLLKTCLSTAIGKNKKKERNLLNIILRPLISKKQN